MPERLWAPRWRCDTRRTHGGKRPAGDHGSPPAPERPPYTVRAAIPASANGPGARALPRLRLRRRRRPGVWRVPRPSRWTRRLVYLAEAPSMDPPRRVPLREADWAPWMPLVRGLHRHPALNPPPSPVRCSATSRPSPSPNWPPSNHGQRLVGLPVIFYTDGPTTQTFTLDIRSLTVDIVVSTTSFTGTPATAPISRRPIPARLPTRRSPTTTPAAPTRLPDHHVGARRSASAVAQTSPSRARPPP